MLFYEFFLERKFLIRRWIDKETCNHNRVIKIERIIRKINIVGSFTSGYVTQNPKFLHGETNIGFTNF